jgi:hypothetical protein
MAETLRTIASNRLIDGEKLDAIVTVGSGTNFLADDGTYKSTPPGSGDVIGASPVVSGNFAGYVGTDGKHIGDSGSKASDFAPASVRLTSVSKTANYSANPGELVSCDVSGGSFTVTLPSSPADKSVIYVKLNKTGTDKYLTLAYSGSDKFNTATGNTQIFMYLFGEYAQCQYDSATGLWYTFISAGTFNFATNFPGIDATTPISAADISIDYGTRVLTITPPLGYFNIFVDGGGVITRYRKVGNISFPAFTDTSGVWFFYFDASGTAITSQTPWSSFSTTCAVYSLCWNATLSGSAKSVKELIETHVNDVSAAEHAWMHKYGSIWFSGLNVANNAIASGAPNADGRNAVIALSTGTVIDDNLPYTITNSTGGGLWEQDMGNTTPASLNATNSALFKCYSQDAGGLVSFIDATRFPFLFNASNTLQYLTSTGTRSDVSTGNFAAYFVFACQDPRSGHSVSIVSAPAQYNTLANAKAVSWTDIVAIYANLGEGAEVRPLYKLIFEYRSAYDVGSKKTAIRQVDDIRKAIVTQSTASIGSVNASAVVYVPTAPLTATNVQSALDEVAGKYPAGAVVGISDTQQLTNKRVTKRLVTVTQSATPTINTDNTDIASITGLAQAITSMTTNLSGTPVNGEMLMVQITDNGTARAITWGASFAATTSYALPTTTVISTLLRSLFQWNSGTSKWECVGTA